MITQEKILAAVEQATGITVDQICSHARSAKIYTARMIAVLVLSQQGYGSHAIAAAIYHDCTSVRRTGHNARKYQAASKLFRDKLNATITILNS